MSKILGTKEFVTSFENNPYKDSFYEDNSFIDNLDEVILKKIAVSKNLVKTQYPQLYKNCPVRWVL